MNNTKLYTIIAVLCAIVLFLSGVIAGDFTKKHHKDFFRPEDRAHHKMIQDKKAHEKGDHHQKRPEKGYNKNKDRKIDGRPDRYHGEFEKSRPHNKPIPCENVSKKVIKIEKSMAEKTKEIFKKSFEDKKEIKQALNDEFAKDELDLEKIEQLFERQTENFVSLQKQAQKAFLETIVTLSKEERTSLVCLQKVKKQKMDNHKKPEPRKEMKKGPKKPKQKTEVRK